MTVSERTLELLERKRYVSYQEFYEELFDGEEKKKWLRTVVGRLRRQEGYNIHAVDRKGYIMLESEIGSSKEVRNLGPEETISDGQRVQALEARLIAEGYMDADEYYAVYFVVGDEVWAGFSSRPTALAWRIK